MLKKYFAFILIIVSTFSLIACNKNIGNAESQDEVTFRLATIVQPTHVWSKTAQKFNEELQARSNGRMKVEIYPSSQLGQEKDMIQQLESGVVDFGFITNAYMSTRAPYFNAWFLPFLFDNTDEVIKMRDSETAKQMLAQLQEQKLIGMDYLFTGNHHILMAKGAINAPENLKGVKIRTTGAPIINETFEEFGASVTSIPLNEVYTAMQTGIVSGMHASVDGIMTQRLEEVSKDYSLISAFAFPAIVVASEETMNNLSAEDQKIVKEAMQVAADWGIQEAVRVDHDDLAKLKKQGLTVHEIENKATFREHVQAIYDKYSEKDPLVEEFIKETQQNKVN